MHLIGIFARFFVFLIFFLFFIVFFSYHLHAVLSMSSIDLRRSFSRIDRYFYISYYILYFILSVLFIYLDFVALSQMLKLTYILLHPTTVTSSYTSCTTHFYTFANYSKKRATILLYFFFFYHIVAIRLCMFFFLYY